MNQVIQVVQSITVQRMVRQIIAHQMVLVKQAIQQQGQLTQLIMVKMDQLIVLIKRLTQPIRLATSQLPYFKRVKIIMTRQLRLFLRVS